MSPIPRFLHHVLALLVVLLAPSRSSRADVIAHDHVSAQHFVRFLHLEDHPDYVFVLSSPATEHRISGCGPFLIAEHGVFELSATNPLADYNAGYFLYALPKASFTGSYETAELTRRLNARIPGMLVSRGLVSPVRTVREGFGPTMRVTTYDVQLGATLDLTIVPESAAPPSPAIETIRRSQPARIKSSLGWIVAATSAVAILGWLWLRRRARPTPEAA